jgi:hypothetical protein
MEERDGKDRSDGLRLAVVMLGGTDAASDFLTVNTIDRHATYKDEGARVRVNRADRMYPRVSQHWALGTALLARDLEARRGAPEGSRQREAAESEGV